MKDYYKIAEELGLDAKNTDFSTLIDRLMEKLDNKRRENRKLLRENERLHPLIDNPR